MESGFIPHMEISMHPMRSSMRMHAFKIRNFKKLKNDTFDDQQLWGFFMASQSANKTYFNT